uniref:Uncharacterized protein n=1 Tax=Panagrolaimus sp. PS1159 TaxID=55785 RepID=A0AC35FSU9_9BILA
MAAQEPKKHDDLDELARKNQELAERSKNRRHDYKLVGSDIIKTDPEPLPTHFKEQIREMLESRISTDTSSINQQDRSGYVTDASSATWQFNNSFSPRSVVSLNGAKAEDVSGLLKVRTTTAPPENEKEKIWPFIPHEIRNTPPDSAQTTMTREISLQSKQRHHHHERYGSMPTLEILEDDKPRSIMKRSQLDSREQMTYAEPERRIVREHHREVVQARPKVTETVQRVEENKHTEEVERRVFRHVRKHKSSRHRSGHGHQEYVDWNGGQWRSNSMQRGGGHNGYLPAYESYNRSTSTRRDRDRDFGDFSSNRFIDNRSGLAHARYGSLSDNRDRDFGDFSSNRFIDNRSGLAHARYGSLSDSLRRGELKYIPNGDVFNDNGREASWRRGSAGPAPFIEFPPTLPRSARGEPPMPPPHRGYSESNSHYRPISKSRSYADWDEGRGPFGSSVKRYDDDMARLENELRDSSLLMRIPNGNMNEKDYRHEQIPGGHETYSRESKANSGRRLNREGVPSDFKEASQEYSFKREVQR